MGQTCMPLTYFCQVAITLPAANGISPLQGVSPAPPLCHILLFTQASTILHHHLPMLNVSGAGGRFNLQSLVNTIDAGQQQQQQEQEQAREEKAQKEDTTVKSWLGPENFWRLLKYC